MGGYNMAMVDEFLDELTDDYTALYKENAALKAKMKVLVEKVEDYRATEDSMRATLLTAQKMADSIVREAEEKRDLIMQEAERRAQEKISALRHQAEEAQDRLRMGQQELASFAESVRTVCKKELLFLEQLPQMQAGDAPTPEKTEPAAEIEETIMDSYRQEEAVPAFASQPIEPPDSAVEMPQDLDISASQEQTEEQEGGTYPEGNPFVPVDEEPTRKLNLEGLKFGRNYNRDN